MKLPDEVKQALQDVFASQLVEMLDRESVIQRVGMHTHEGAWLATSAPDQWMDILRASIDIGPEPEWTPIDDDTSDDDEDSEGSDDDIPEPNYADGTPNEGESLPNGVILAPAQPKRSPGRPRKNLT